LGLETELQVGTPGQFDVLVDGEVIARRGGSFLARLFGGGWPDSGAVVEAIRSRKP
jgi:hypothetical protein